MPFRRNPKFNSPVFQHAIDGWRAPSFFHVLCGVFAWNKFCRKGQFTWILCHFSLFSRFYIHFFSMRAPAFTRRSIYKKDNVLRSHFHLSPKSIGSIAMIFQILKFKKNIRLWFTAFQRGTSICSSQYMCTHTFPCKYPLVKFYHDHSPNIRMLFSRYLLSQSVYRSSDGQKYTQIKTLKSFASAIFENQH